MDIELRRLVRPSALRGHAAKLHVDEREWKILRHRLGVNRLAVELSKSQAGELGFRLLGQNTRVCLGEDFRATVRFVALLSFQGLHFGRSIAN